MSKKSTASAFRQILLYLLGICIFLPLLFTKKDLVLIPSAESYKLSAYSDKTDSTGKTKVSAVYTKDTTILFNYTLINNDSMPQLDPFAGLAVELCKKAPFVDISDYDYLHVDIIVRHASSFIINIKTFIEGFTNIDDWHTYHIETIQVPVHLGSINYRIHLSDLRIPEWWWKEVGPVAANLPRNADRKKLFGIDFQNGSGTPKNVDDQIIIKRIQFCKDNTRLQITLSIVFIIYIGFILFLSRMKKNKKLPENTGLSYKKLEISNSATEESARITSFVGKNFQNPDLTVDIVAHEVGISLSRISTVLQKAYALTFKQYLNEIRITEAKRLLKETDRSITEIGFAVGYNSITHFNRVFKLDTDLSPSEFREQMHNTQKT